MSVFGELLRIKEFREGLAETDLRRRRALAEEARLAQEALEKRLVDYRSWAVRREDELFRDLCVRPVRLRDIETMRNRITDMRHEERSMEQGVLDAAKQREAAHREAEAASRRLQDASRQRNKFVELARIYSEEARLELERAEEAEMEEFRVAGGGDDEWEGQGSDDFGA